MKLYPFVQNLTSFPFERWRAKAPAYLAAALLLGSLNPKDSLAQESSPAADDLRSLKQKLQELEQKLQALERTKASAPTTNAGPSVEELEQKVKILERNRELEQEAAEAKAKDAPKISIGEKGFSFSTADTNFAVQLKGLLQVDSRTFLDDSGIVGNDGILLRRARPILQGTVFRDFDFLFVPDFAGSSTVIQDAYLNYRYSPGLQLQAGKFKVPVGLELLQSDKDTFFTERALPSDLVPNRDLGFNLHGDLFESTVSYAVGLYDGIGDGANNTLNKDFDDNKEVAARLFVQPFKTTSVTALKGLGVGLAGSYDLFQATNSSGLPNNNGYATPAQQQFFTYRSSVAAGDEHWRLSPQAYYYYGPFGLLGEYVISDQKVVRTDTRASARLEHTAWQVAAGWVLTGEDATYSGVVPRRPFNPHEGGWGAWQLVARYSELDLDSDTFPLFADPTVSANKAQEWAVGLNWYLNRNVRVSATYSHVEFGGAGARSPAPGPVTRKDENVLFTRIQLAF